MKEKSASASLFYTHGILCVSHPVEVLLVCVTSTVCLITLNIYDATHIEANDGSEQKGLANKVCVVPVWLVLRNVTFNLYLNMMLNFHLVYVSLD